MSEFGEKEEKHKKSSSCVFYFSFLQHQVNEPSHLIALWGALRLLESWEKAASWRPFPIHLFHASIRKGPAARRFSLKT